MQALVSTFKMCIGNGSNHLNNWLCQVNGSSVLSMMSNTVGNLFVCWTKSSLLSASVFNYVSLPSILPNSFYQSWFVVTLHTSKRTIESLSTVYNSSVSSSLTAEVFRKESMREWERKKEQCAIGIALEMEKVLNAGNIHQG